MPLETNIKNLDDSIKALTETVSGLAEELLAKSSSATVTEKKPTAKKPTAKKPTAKKEVADDGDDDSLLDKVRESLKGVVTTRDRKAASAILTEYGGVSKLTELDPENYENVILACENVLVNDDDY